MNTQIKVSNRKEDIKPAEQLRLLERRLDRKLLTTADVAAIRKELIRLQNRK